METVFLVCFLFGVLFIFASFLLGFAHTGLHLGDGGVHADPAGHDVIHHGDSSHGGLPLLNVSSLLAFLTWFGAIGYGLLRFGEWSFVPTLLVAIVAGAVGAYLIALLLGKLLASSRELDPRDYKLEGTIARVTSTIFEGGVGEIMFSQAGQRRSESARSRSGAPVPRDSEVVVIDYDRGIAIVEPWEEFIGSKEPDELKPGT